MTTAATISEPAEQPVPTTAHSTTTAASVGPGRRLPQPSERAMAMRRPVMATKAPGSPTDKMMSPCSKALNQRRRGEKGIRPKLLADVFKRAMKEQQQEAAAAKSSGAAPQKRSGLRSSTKAANVFTEAIEEREE